MIDEQWEFDSTEEQDFWNWCVEAREHGFIDSFEYHPDPIVLSEKQSIKEIVRLKTKTKVVEKHLFHPHEYTADFVIKPLPYFADIDHKLSITKDGLSYWIDVKGTFNQHDGLRSFSINQKWVYQRYGIIINKVVPVKFFKRTWVPLKSRFSPIQKKLRKCYIGCKTVNQIIKTEDIFSI